MIFEHLITIQLTKKFLLGFKFLKMVVMKSAIF